MVDKSEGDRPERGFSVSIVVVGYLSIVINTPPNDQEVR